MLTAGVGRCWNAGQGTGSFEAMRPSRLASALVVPLALAVWPRAVEGSQGRLETARVPAPSLVGALLESHAVRRAVVYLPPSYDEDDDRRYPVVYLLHSFGAGPEAWLGVSGYEGMNVARSLDAQFRTDPTAEFIVVMPDARTRFGGSWYANSPATGRWTDFVARDLVSFVDRAFRTRPDPASRALVGQSMGGYGALRVALWYPDTFGAVVALSSPNLMSTNPFGVEGVRSALAVPDPTTLDLAGPVPRVLWSKAVAFAPDPAHPPFYGRLPWRPTADGRLEHDPMGWPAWEESALVNHLEERAPALAPVEIRIEVGSADPLRDESERFARRLQEHGVRPRFELFEGDHVRGVRDRLEDDLLPWLGRFLTRPPRDVRLPRPS